MNTKTTLGINAGFVAAFIYVGTYFTPLFLLGALIYVGVKETNELVKKSAKTALFIFLIYEAVMFLFNFIDEFFRVIGIRDNALIGTLHTRFSAFFNLAYIVVIVVFAIIALVKGLPAAAPAPVQQAAPVQQTVPTTHVCPNCKTVLTGAGYCPQCGTKVD